MKIPWWWWAWCAVGLVFWGVIFYVAWHFISKWW